MSSKTKSLKQKLFSFSVSLVLINLLCAFIFLTFVASHFYRKQDQENLKQYAHSLVKVYESEGFDHAYREEFLWIQVKEKGEIVFQQYPRKLKNTERDILKSVELRTGFQSIDLSTLEEDDSYYDQVKSKVAAYLMKEEYYTLASILNDDFFDIYVAPVSADKVLIVGRDAEEREEMLQDLRSLMALSFIPALIIALIMSYFMGRFFLRPIDELIGSLRRGKVSLNEEKAPTEIIHLKNEFEKLYLSLKETLDNVAHDLKTPLTHLKMNSEEGILNDEDAASLKERLGENMEAADTILSILRSLMDVKEAQSGSLFLQNEKIELDHLVERVVEMHSFIAEEKKIKIEMDLRHLTVLGDETRLFQVFSNLLDNGLKFSSDSSVLKVRIYQENKWAVVEIQDQGQGIEAEEISRIWDRLYRGDKSRSTKGFGIGLSLVKAYTEAHKGEVSVVSAPGKGSQFFVKLPICNV